MRLNLWLAQPETERKLAAALRVAAVAFACWTVAAAYGLWSTRSALATSQLAVASQSNKICAVAREIPQKRKEAAKADRVQVAAPESTASADLANELSRIAQGTGVEIAGVRIGGDGPQGKAAAPASPGTTGAGPSSPTPAPVGDGWDQETFECSVAGGYGALTRFLNVLASSSHVMDITSIEMTQGGAKPDSDAPPLEMKLNGIVYERPEKP